MDVPVPTALLAALAEFVRSRLGAVTDRVSDRVGELPDNVAVVVVGAAGVFAPTSYSRARLARQMYASGLLSGSAPSVDDTGCNSEGRQPRVLA